MRKRRIKRRKKPRKRPTLGGQLLRSWLKRSGYERRYFAAAKLLGVDNTTLSHMLSGHDTPSLPKGVEIEDLTGVPARAWATRLEADSADTAADTAKKTRLR